MSHAVIRGQDGVLNAKRALVLLLNCEALIAKLGEREASRTQNCFLKLVQYDGRDGGAVGRIGSPMFSNQLVFFEPESTVFSKRYLSASNE
jgi:hypothetical protein